MDDVLADILDTCLGRLAAGASVEDCLADFPQHRAALEAPLRAAAAARQLPAPPAMPTSARVRLETSLLALAAQRRAVAPSQAPPPASDPGLAPAAVLAGLLRALGYRGRLDLALLRLASVALALLIALLLAAGVAVAARALLRAALPPAAPTATPAAQQRFTLRGPIEALGPDEWRVDGLRVRLDAATAVEGAPAVGAVAEVRGVLAAGGRLLARRIVVLAPPSPTPTTTATPPPPTATPPPPTATPPPPTATPVPPPAPPPPPPAPPGGDDDGGDDDGGDDDD